VERQIMK